MDQVLYNTFFDDYEGIFPCMRDKVPCESQKEKAKTLLSSLNEKIKKEEITNAELKVLVAIITELANNSDKRDFCDYFSEVQKVLKDAFLTLEDYKELRGE